MATVTGIEFYGRLYTVQVDALIFPDGWAAGSRLVASDWDGADYRLPSVAYTDVVRAVNVAITGRSIQKHRGYDVVRVRIEFVGDGEESTFHPGWMAI